jgi:phage-related minor tail protein
LGALAELEARLGAGDLIGLGERFAGGRVSAPTYFPTSTGLGLAGEAGPEAIVPLSRGADGRLGLAGGASGVNVTFNVTANDARSFAASEAEISAMLLRAVKRGTRAS